MLQKLLCVLVVKIFRRLLVVLASVRCVERWFAISALTHGHSQLLMLHLLRPGQRCTTHSPIVSKTLVQHATRRNVKCAGGGQRVVSRVLVVKRDPSKVSGASSAGLVQLLLARPLASRSSSSPHVAPWFLRFVSPAALLASLAQPVPPVLPALPAVPAMAALPALPSQTPVTE